MAFDYAKAYQQFIDEEFAAASATAWMIPEAGKVRFTGGRDIEISTLSTTGLGNYDAGKADGSAYPQGTVTNSWKSYTLSMDRGVKFSLDRTDPNDTGFLVTAENVIREFARNALVKEQDTYRIHRLYELANGDAAHKASHIVSAALTKTNAIATVSGLLQTVRDDAEEMDGYVALISHKHKTAFLEAANGTYHDISFGNAVSINGVTYENVMMLDDLPCVFVPQSRMKTVITVQSGDSDQGGIVAGVNAKDIACLITHCETPLAVSKLDAIKQFGPQENQLFDGTSIQARYLYDLFVPGKRLAGRSLGENGDALTEMAMERACAWCGREDIPEAMEQAVAALLLNMEGREAAVKSVTRGDTSVTYAVSDGQSAALAGLAPWRRLGRLKEG